MLLFIVIFFAMVIVVGTAAVAGFSFYLKRRTRRLQTHSPLQFNDEPPPYRSLFEPASDEIRVLGKAEIEKAAAKATSEARLLQEKKFQAVRDFKEIWTNEPNKTNTVGLLRLASVAENAGIFSETAETVIEFWRENKIANLAAGDLADLLDSHLGTLPQQERTAGAVFWLRREIMSLRAGSE